MTLVLPTQQSSPTFDGQAVIDSTDFYAMSAEGDLTGVTSGGTVSAHSGMQVSVAAGSGYYQGSTFSWSAATPTAASASASDRRDIVVVSSTGTVSIIEGTPCGTAGWTRSSGTTPPVKPAVPTGSVLLGELYIASTTSTVAAGNIVDKTPIIAIPSGGGGGMSNPMTSTGDIIYGGSGGTPARLAVGSAGQILTVASGVPAWETLSGANPQGILSLGTVTSTTQTLPASSYSVVTATGTSGASTPFVLPHAAASSPGDFYLFYTNSSGTVDNPTIAAASGETLNWLAPMEWYPGTGWTNVVYFQATASGVWSAQPITWGLGVFALVQEQVYTNASASGTVTLQDPTASPYYTVQIYEVPNSGTLTLANPTYRTGASFQVRIVTGTGTTVNLPSTNTRWAGTTSGAGAAPTVGASETWDFTVKMVDGTHYDWAFVGRFA